MRSDPQNLRILYEDNHLIIVNKRSGDIVQGDSTGDTPLVDIVKQYIKVKYNKPGNVFLGLVHRLDRPTSGIVVMARTSKALTRMTKIFKDRKVQKTYWAISKNKPDELQNKLIHFLKKNEAKNKAELRNREFSGSKRAELSYQLIGSQKELHLLEVKPVTGRQHQIRVQLSSINCPILGDLKYGYKGKSFDGAIFLHARSLEFVHPTTKEPMKIDAPAPNILEWNYFTA